MRAQVVQRAGMRAGFGRAALAKLDVARLSDRLIALYSLTTTAALGLGRAATSLSFRDGGIVAVKQLYAPLLHVGGFTPGGTSRRWSLVTHC